MKEVTALARPIEETKLGLRTIVLNKTKFLLLQLVEPPQPVASLIMSKSALNRG